MIRDILVYGCGVVGVYWFYRFVDLFLNLPKVANIATDDWDMALPTQPKFTVIVPARNEEKDIVQCLESLAESDYQNLEIVAINDRSTDRTGELIDRMESKWRGRVRAIHIRQLPPGWLGKTHAMWTGARESQGEWILFTDGDIMFRRDALRRAVAYCQLAKADHLVVYPRWILKSIDETVMAGVLQSIPVRPWKMKDPKSRDFIGIGAFNMVRREVYERVGGFEKLRLQVIDDLFLGRNIKRAGFSQHCVFGEDLVSLHWAEGALGIAKNLTKNTFAVMGFRWYVAVVALIGTFFFSILPYIGIFAGGWMRIVSAFALLGIIGSYAMGAPLTNVPWWIAFLHPFGAVVAGYSIVRSVFYTYKQGGIEWRGTKYSLKELKKS